MKINKKQAKALELLISNMGQMNASEQIDNDGSKYIECECKTLSESWVINTDGECCSADGRMWVDEDGNWVA